MITLTENQWKPILNRLQEEWAHKPSVFIMREVMKRELGFVDRTSIEWINKRRTITYYLDFYDEPAETMFRLRYL